MGLFGSLRNPSQLRNDFARLLMQNLKQQGETRPMRYRSDDFALELGEDQVSLEPHFQLFFDAPVEEHDAVMASIFEALRSPLLATDYAHIKAILMPVLRSHMESNNRALQLRAHGIDAGEEVLTPLASDLVVGVVIDSPHYRQTVMTENLSRWGVSLNDVQQTAIENLKKESKPCFTEIDTGIYQSAWCDYYDAARLLLPDLFLALGFQGSVVVMPTNEDRVLVTCSADPHRLARMIELATHFLLNEGKPLVPDVFQWTSNTWRPLDFGTEHPGHWKHHGLVKMWMANVYAHQQAALRKLYTDEERDPFISTYSLAKRGEAVESYTAWTQGIAVPLWLPQVDTIVLVPEEGDPQPVPWAQLERVLAPIPRVPTVPPPARFEVRGFPTSDQIKLLGENRG
jgi:hypothetical protein